ISDTAPLRSSCNVRVAVVDTDVHARIDYLLLRLREAAEGARLLRSEGVGGGHLKGQLISTEEALQHVRNRATDVSVTRRVLGKIGCIDERLPNRIDLRGWISVLVFPPDRRDRTPKVVKVFAVPTGDLGVGQGGLSKRKHAGRVAGVMQVGTRDIAQSVLPQQRTAIGPEVTDLRLLRGARGAGQRTHRLCFVVVVCP